MTSLVILLISCITFAQNKEFQLSTHILDVSQGLPAQDVEIRLEKLNPKTNNWEFVSKNKTNKDGRIGDFLASENENTGIYKFTFFTEDYFKKQDKQSFYPFIEVVFEIKDEKHYHVPITLSAFGYSTYRGS